MLRSVEAETLVINGGGEGGQRVILGGGRGGGRCPFRRL